MGIVNDLSKGKEGEQAVIDCFGTHDIVVDYNKKKNSTEYDLSFDYNKKRYTIEVKYDIMAEKTGNIAIEYFNCRSNKPSGIMATKSSFWACFLGRGELWICATVALLQFTQSAKPVRIVSRAGDGNASLLLYEKSHIFDIFNRIDNIERQIFRDILEKEIRKIT